MTAKLIRIGTALALLFCLSALSYAGNIDPDGDGHKHAWSENAGWLNFEPSQEPGSTVADDFLTGYVWSENAGWIKFDPDNCNDCGVKNDGSGNLSGWAWGENIGWISFSCLNTGSCGTINYGVVIDQATGEFSGNAWSENIGWINFNYSQAAIYGVKTAWTNNAVAVPVLNAWGMIISVLFLTGSAVWLLRRRKRII